MKSGKFFFLLLLLAFKAEAQVTEEWIARHADSSTIPGGANSMVLDGEGFAYVTGTSQRDYFTIKYNPAGEPVWTARYNGPANGTDVATAITVDQAGNVYVTGRSYRSFVGFQLHSDFATIKYNSDGVQQWVQRYNGPANGNNYAIAIATDPAGNVYVTGNSTAENGLTDYATIKYNSAGAEQWVQRYNGPGDNTDYANSIAVDEFGNVFVTGGRSYGTEGNREFATIKYNTQGEQQWIAVYNGGGFYSGEGRSVKLDDMGNVYVTGISRDTHVTIKYNSDGEEQWVHVDNAGINNSASAMAVNGSGNVYVTGSIRDFNETGTDYYTIKYNTNGVQQWTAIYNGPANMEDNARAIAVDEFGSVYITGTSRGIETLDDYATVKYNSDGVEQWVQRYNGPANNHDFATSIAVDGSGNVFVTGASEGDYLTIKYIQEEKRPPTNLTYDLVTHSLKWTRSPSGGVINQLVFKQEYDPWTQTAGPWISVADSGGLLTPDKSDWVIQTSGYYNFKIGALFESDSLYTDSVYVSVGYRLRKIENDEVIAFNFETDAFKLIRNSENWPESWWSQFNYNDPFSYSPLLLFAGRPDSVYADWPLYTNIIGEEQAYLSTTLNIANLTPALQWRWTSGPFEGACAGFSISSLLSFYKNPDYLSQFPYMAGRNPGSIPKTDANARKVINHLQNTQIFTQPSTMVSDPLDSAQQVPDYVLKRLTEIFSDYENRTLDQYISLKTDGGYHAVLPVAINKPDFTKNRYDVLVYDSNFPEEYMYILIFTENNSWVYQDFTDQFIGISLRGPLTSRLGILSFDPDYTIPENPSAKSSVKPVASTTKTVYTSGSSSVTVLVDNDTLAGYDIVNNTIVSFENSIVEATDGILRAPKGYVLPIGETGVIFTDQIEGSSAGLMFRSPGGNYYSAERTDGAGLDEAEFIEINDEGFTYLNNDDVNKTISLISVFEDNSQSKLAKISSIGIGGNEEISLSLVEDEVLLKNAGGAKTYTINLLYATSEQQLEFNTASVPLAENTTHYIQPAWEALSQSTLDIYIDNGNNGTIDDTLTVINQVTAIENDQGSISLPETYQLAQNYPNPFNPSTVISYQLPSAGQVTIKVYDFLGREVALLVNEFKAAGRYEAAFDGSNLASGVYLYSIQAVDASGSRRSVFEQTRKMLLIK
jgi:uncharacterized delta-60 repeat protein